MHTPTHGPKILSFWPLRRPKFRFEAPPWYFKNGCELSTGLVWSPPWKYSRLHPCLTGVYPALRYDAVVVFKLTTGTNALVAKKLCSSTGLVTIASTELMHIQGISSRNSTTATKTAAISRQQRRKKCSKFEVEFCSLLSRQHRAIATHRYW